MHKEKHINFDHIVILLFTCFMLSRERNADLKVKI